MYKEGSGYNTILENKLYFFYCIFAGQDCSVNLAKMSLKKEDLNTFGKVELNAREMEILKEWETKFRGKYKIVGTLKK